MKPRNQKKLGPETQTALWHEDSYKQLKFRLLEAEIEEKQANTRLIKSQILESRKRRKLMTKQTELVDLQKEELWLKNTKN